MYSAIGARLASQGRLDRALAVLDSVRIPTAQGYGIRDTGYAVWSSRANLEWAALCRDIEGLPASRQAIADVTRIVLAHPEDQELTHATALDDALARKDTLAAVTIVRRSVHDLLPGESPFMLGLAHWHLARGENAGGHHEEALQAVRDGRRWIADTPDLESVLPLLRREEYVALKALGRTNEADSLRRSVPTRGPMAPGTPGGAWNGCPDVP